MAKERNLTEVQGTGAMNLEIGESVAGYLDGISEGQYGPVYEIKDEDSGDVQSVFGKTILQSKLGKIPIGCYVKIERLPDRKTNTGRTAQDFKVLFDEEEAKSLKDNME